MKFKARKGVTGLSFDGEEFTVDENGEIEIGGKLTAREVTDIESHGFTRSAGETSQTRKVPKTAKAPADAAAGADPKAGQAAGQK